jgi:putative colanic acid biosynthesis acetyltransferase WcaF
MPGQPPPPPRRTTWTARQNLLRVVWSSLGRLAWVLLPPCRSSLLRLFGATVGPGCRFARSVEIDIPWTLHIGRNVQVGEQAILYGLGMITIGDDVVLDRKAHLCAGTHDMDDPQFALLRPPVTVGDGCFIGYDAYIGPGVALGSRCRVLPRASVYRNWGDDLILRGNPAAAIQAGETPSPTEDPA